MLKHTKLLGEIMSNEKEGWQKRNGADYTILADNNYKWMFLDGNNTVGKGYISYRQVIAHSIYSAIKNNIPLDTIKADIKELSEKDFQNCDNKEYSMFSFACLNKEPYMIIKDKSCYPLLIRNSTYRSNALQHAFKNIHKNFDKIVALLLSEWTPELEVELNNLYDCSNKSE